MAEDEQVFRQKSGSVFGFRICSVVLFCAVLFCLGSCREGVSEKQRDRDEKTIRSFAGESSHESTYGLIETIKFSNGTLLDERVYTVKTALGRFRFVLGDAEPDTPVVRYVIEGEKSIYAHDGPTSASAVAP